MKKTVSKIDKNKKELFEKTEEKIVTTKMLVREFKCSCGVSVRLEGTVATDKSIVKCSKCR